VQIHDRSVNSDIRSHLRITGSPDDPALRSGHQGLLIICEVGARALHVDIRTFANHFMGAVTVALALSFLWVLRAQLGASCSEGFLLLGAVVLLIVTPIYLPYHDPNLYLGKWSPNIWHNPTLLTSKPLVIPVFHLFPFLLASMWSRRAAARVALLAAMLLAATFIKPSFAFTFVPAAVLVRHLRSPRAYLVAAALVLPAALALLYQQAVTFGQDDTNGITFAFLRVWSSWTRSIPTAILQAAAFPLAILIFRFRRCLRDDHLVLSWLFYLVALAQWSLLAETGRYQSHGNFGWGYALALTFLFLYSAVELIRWMAEIPRAAPWQRVAWHFAAALLGLHFASGIFYVIKYMVSGRYL
jgi:hypothetical protein